MSDIGNDIPSLYLHQEVRLRIAARELVENARRIFELCHLLGIDPESISPEWKKEDVEITEEILNLSPSLTPREYDGNVVFCMSDPLGSAVVIRDGHVVDEWAKKLLLRELAPTAESLEYHISKHVLLLKKYNEISNEKKLLPSEWVGGGLFHWCQNCDQVFGTLGVDDQGRVICAICGNKGTF
jgi:hypothetical protein